MESQNFGVAAKSFAKKSQRDFVIEPKVGPGRTGEELPWANQQDKIQPQRGGVRRVIYLPQPRWG